MPKKDLPPTHEFDPKLFAQNLAKVADIYQEIWEKSAENYSHKHMMESPFDPFNLADSFSKIQAQWLSDPSKLAQQHYDFCQQYLELCQYMQARMLGDEEATSPLEDIQDRRFKAADWQENLPFDFIRQSYLLTANWLNQNISETEGIDEKTRHKVQFFTQQFVDAMSPSNFVMTNPEVLKTTLQSNGENLLKGIQNLSEDMKDGRLSISMTDSDAFEVGKNLACAKGAVVFENELMQLIHYAPTTKTVYPTPILLIPAWINKYYIFDLSEKNSLIQWLVAQGHTVFAISWANPDETLTDKRFEDYIQLGPLAALDAIERITKQKTTHTAGYCLGGTLLATTLSYLHHHQQAHRIASATYFTTLVDFSHAGDLGVFIDDKQLEQMEEKMAAKGYLEGHEMAQTFNMLRANDLIWSFVVNNYLLGKEPFPFDLLFWNADTTRMPAKMHSYYLRNMYQHNNLISGKLTLLDTPIDLSRIATPSFILSTREDHIAPWQSTYAATERYSGPVEFVLAASGHVAGVINPPVKNKYHFWTNSNTPPTPDAWLNKATQHPGSWWPHWQQWLAAKNGKRIPAKKLAKGIEPAPGRYVKG